MPCILYTTYCLLRCYINLHHYLPYYWRCNNTKNASCIFKRNLATVETRVRSGMSGVLLRNFVIGYYGALLMSGPACIFPRVHALGKIDAGPSFSGQSPTTRHKTACTMQFLVLLSLRTISLPHTGAFLPTTLSSPPPQ